MCFVKICLSKLRLQTVEMFSLYFYDTAFQNVSHVAVGVLVPGMGLYQSSSPASASCACVRVRSSGV